MSELSSAVNWRVGDVVGWWDGSELLFGVVAGEDKQKLLAYRGANRPERVKPGRLAMAVSGQTPPGPVDPGQARETLASIPQRLGAVGRAG